MNYSVTDGFPYYIEMANNCDVTKVFESNPNVAFFESINEEQAQYIYASGKWSVKEVLGHITDHERIMVYRLLRISRKDTTSLEGYDQEILLKGARFNELDYELVLNDYKAVRMASVSFIRTLSQEQLALVGQIWKFEYNVSVYLQSIIGHEHHHVQILKDRYNIA